MAYPIFASRLLGALLPLALMLGCSGSGSGSGHGGGQSTPGICLGYYTEYQGLDEAYASVVSSRDHLTAISADVFRVDAEGSVEGTVENARVMDLCRTEGIQVYACVTNWGDSGFDRDLVHAVLTEHPARAIDGLLDLAQRPGFAGVNLDFENIEPADRPALTRFVHDLASRLHATRRALVVSVPALQEDDPGDDWSSAFDYRALGRDADLLQLMTYDEHGPGYTDPGPVAGCGWVERCLAYAVSVVDPAKLLIGLPAYGYDWKRVPGEGWTEGTGSFPWRRRPTTGVLWDAASRSPYVTYTDGNGVPHQAWFENPDSIRAKMTLVRAYHLAGTSVWSLGQEDSSFWQAVADGL